MRNRKQIQGLLELRTGDVREFRASNVRKNGTGTHAKIEILWNGTVLAHDVMNIERDASRAAIVRPFYDKNHPILNDIERGEYPRVQMKKDLDEFTSGIWEQWLDGFVSEDLYGSDPLEETNFIAAPHIPEDSGVIVFGPPERGKSWIGLLLACSVRSGVSKIWQCAERRPVLYVNLERGGQRMARRIAQVNLALDLPSSTPLRCMNYRGMSVSAIREGIEREVDRLGENTLVIYDSLSRAGAGAMKDDDVANSTMDICNAVSRNWVILGHTPRADDTHPFGSIMYEAAADVCVRQLAERKDDGTLGIGLEMTKANDVPRASMMVVEIGFHRAGMAGAQRTTASQWPELSGQKKTSLNERIVNLFVTENGEWDAGQIADFFGEPRLRPQIAGYLSGREGIDYKFMRKVGKNSKYRLLIHAAMEE